ncbi:MAG TPA: hypothetical protein VIK18_05255, partial [Pirellulales bacterium]
GAIASAGDGSVPQLTAADARERIVRLAPGEEVTRTIDLTRGFTVFETAVSSSPAGLHAGVSACECACRVRDRRELKSVTVDYEQPYTFADGFRAYTGLAPDALRLYSGPLSATIERPVD